MKRLYDTSLFSLAALAMFAQPNEGGTMSFLGTPGGDEGKDSLSTEAKQIGDQQGKTSDGIKMLGAADPRYQDDGAIGLTGKVAYVNKQGAEGLLAIDAFTGMVIVNADTPEWATDLGVANAILTERHSFYASRLGQQYADAHVSPEVYAFEDLAWLQLVDDGAEGTEAIVEADAEHRQEVLAAVLGVNRATGDIEGAQLSIEVVSDNTRTEAELAALEEAKQAPAVAAEAQG